MRIKKLEITGFKSFCEKTGVLFPAGITAVVGPNGCGKSNIIDAIRWVMGEQSVKQLRGKAMEDVIFAGTNGKKPLGMAEVSMIIENSNGQAPEELKDYPEIMVTRRLYRSGESAYLLNKRPCRLKDIQNVFLGSGAGSRSYSIIQQGNIGAITDAGPDERRSFIEEAAGTTRYKTRKKEALRKLKATNQNLLRANDIISEISRQMAGLKRQAKRAERFKRYQQRLQELDLHVSFHYFDQHTEQLEKADTMLVQLRDTDLQHSAQLKSIDAAVEKIKLRRSEKNQQIADQRAQKFDAQRKMDRLETDLAHLRQDVSRLNGEIGAMDESLSALTQQNEKIALEIEEGEQQAAQIVQSITEVQADLQKEQSTTQSTRQQVAELKQALEKAKSGLMDRIGQETRYQNVFQNATSSKESLQRRIKRADEEELSARRKNEQMRREYDDCQAQIQQLTAEMEDQQAVIDRQKEQLQQWSLELGAQVKKVQSLDYERGGLHSRHGALKKMAESLDWYRDGVRAILKAADAPQNAESAFSGELLGLMADILHPHPGYETAVEAALGEALQYICVRDAQTAMDALDFLKAHKSGRGGFLAIHLLEKKAPHPAFTLPAGAKSLLNCVEVEKGFETVAQHLLGAIAVAESLPSAFAWRENEYEGAVVTRSGDILSPEGVLIGGSQEQLAGILAKKQEMRDLEAQLAAVDQKLKDERERQQSLEEKIKSKEVALHHQFEEKAAIEKSQTEAQRAMYRIDEQLKQAQRHLEIVQLEQEQLMGEEMDADEEISRTAQAVEKVQNEVQAGQQQVDALTLALQKANDKLEQFNQRAMDLKVRLTSLEARKENNTQALQRIRSFRDDGVRRLKQASEDLERKKRAQNASQEKIGQIEKDLQAAYETLKALTAELERNEADYQSIDEQLQQNTQAVSEIQSQREKAIEQQRLLELEQQELRMKRDHIVHRFAERYGQPLRDFRRQMESETAKLEMSIAQLESERDRFQKKVNNYSDVNLGAIKEYELLKGRFDFLCEQRDDLEKAINDLHQVIRKINRISQERFLETFTAVNEKLKEVFPRLFEGGSAKLIMTEPGKPLESGVEFMVHPPGKKLTRLSLMSGGEKAMSAIAFIFSIFLIKPAAFCLLDEIDAPLDDANVFRFNDLLAIIGENSQIIMITHNKRSMEFADTLFGITMEKKGVSKMVSVNLARPAGHA